ncbi:hypothetical protein BT63DRAFT_411173 [Microthyrium microscopicum]|uniref:Uncharacterized protein n=1 Tax=Microthyrium microscopicum TaxID=703497 RepID=A0A6A6UL79_9PEZI|nr:hypothetical protein BT63DRAFT_411173 [Microthyrium microscopicum]
MALTLYDEIPRRGLQIMFAAAVKGKAWVIEALLDMGVTPQPMPSTEDDQTAVSLHAAVFHGRLDCEKLLIEQGGVDVNTRCDMVLENRADPMLKQTEGEGTNALEFAISGGNIECEQLLLKTQRRGVTGQDGADVLLSGEEAITLNALKAAAKSRNVEMLRLILEQDDAPALRILLSYIAQPDDAGFFTVLDLIQGIKERIMDMLFTVLKKPELFKLMCSVSFSSPDLTTMQYENRNFSKTEYLNHLVHNAAQEGALECVMFILTIPGV